MTRRRARGDFLQQGDFRHKFGAAELEPCRRAVRAEIALDRLAVAAESIPKGNPGLACAQDFKLARFGEWVKTPRPCNEHLSTSRNQVDGAPDCPSATRPRCNRALGGAASAETVED